MLRDSHEEFTPGKGTRHGAQTGKQASATKVVNQTKSVEEERKADWAKQRQSRVDLLSAAEVFDPMGQTGIWDILNNEIGVKSIPQKTSEPWAFILHNGIVLLVWQDGKVQLNIQSGTVDDAEKLEDFLDSRGWQPASPFRSYGRAGREASQRARFSLCPDGQDEAMTWSPDDLKKAEKVTLLRRIRKFVHEVGEGLHRNSRGQDKQHQILATVLEAELRLLRTNLGNLDLTLTERQLPGIAALLRWVMEQMDSFLIGYKKLIKGSTNRADSLIGPFTGPLQVMGELKRSRNGAMRKITKNSEEHLTGGCLSYGYSGGAAPGQSSLLPQRWMDVDVLAQSLRVDWFFATGCRVGNTSNIAAEVPAFSYEVFAPRGSGFAAVNLMVGVMAKGIVHYQPNRSLTPRACWVLVSVSNVEVWIGLYVPPLGENHSETSRERVRRQAFVEWDDIQQKLNERYGKDGARPRMFGVGDLNPSPYLEDISNACLQKGAYKKTLHSVRARMSKGGIWIVRGQSETLVMAVPTRWCTMGMIVPRRAASTRYAGSRMRNLPAKTLTIS